MPPKRARAPTKRRGSPAKDTKKTGKSDAFERKLQKAQDLEPFIRSVVSNLMFSSGDDEHPLQENEDLVVDLLKNELVLLLEDVVEVHESHLPVVKLSHILPILKSQKGILSRFLKYLENRVQMAAFMKSSKSYSNKNQYRENFCGQEIESDDEKVREDGVDPMDELGDVDGAEGEYLKKKRKKFGSVTAEEALLQDVREMFSEAGLDVKTYKEIVDEKFDSQQTALQNVIRNMSAEDYGSYSVARRTSFQLHSPVLPASSSLLRLRGDNWKRKLCTPVNNRRSLLTWIGNPPIQTEAALVFMAFLAKEIVSEVVGSAVVERFRRDPALSGPISNCYYEEFLRKNQKFRKYGRVLL